MVSGKISSYCKRWIDNGLQSSRRAVLLDLGLPDENGHIVLQKLRQWYTPPLLFYLFRKMKKI
jgi:DNA-binding response OmpR family regulator